MTVPPDPPTAVLILHGWQNKRPAGHWQHLLADDLRADGLQVRYPQLPDPDMPDWARWRAAVAEELAALAGPRRAVIAHSLAAWVVLSLLVESNLLLGMRILLVAPVARETLARNPPITAFDRGLDVSTLRELIVMHGGIEIVCSDDDPYWPGGAAGWASELGATVHPLTGQGHLALDDGYGRWPAVGGWVHRGGVIIARE